MQATIHLIAPSMTSTTFTARVIPSISAVDAKGWDACANPPGRSADEAEGERFNPFITHAFLNALEASGSVGGRSGWTPAHVTVEDGRGRLVAAAPAYLKSHSQGEYVFDHAWADAYERAGGRYYPKLQVAAPFTPVTGRRLLIAAGAAQGAREALIGALRELRKQTKASSIHVTFPTAEDAERLSNAGFLLRTGEQVHFSCEGFANLHDFLAAPAPRKRKAINPARALGRFLQVLHPPRLTQMGPPLPDSRVLRPDWGDARRPRAAGDGAPRRRLYRRRDQFHRRRRALWPQLGRDRGPAVFAFRGLLLPGYRLCAFARIAADRGRRPGRAQAGARLSSGPHLFGARIRRRPTRQGHRRLSRTRARSSRAHDRPLRGTRAFPSRRRRRGWRRTLGRIL